jgi:hypothetical protein
MFALDAPIVHESERDMAETKLSASEQLTHSTVRIEADLVKRP